MADGVITGLNSNDSTGLSQYIKAVDNGDSTSSMAVFPWVNQTVSITPTISATPDYVSTDGAGGIQTIAAAVGTSGRPVKLESVVVVDKGGQAPAFTILLFKATPAGGTYTDNATLVLSAADVGNLIGCVKVLNADYITPSSGIRMVTYSDIDAVLPVSATSLYALLLVDAGWNAGSTTDVTITFGFQRG